MVKRMFSTSTGSKPNTGGICSKCRNNVGVTIYIDEFQSQCVSCQDTPGVCYLVSRKGAVKLIPNLPKDVKMLPHSKVLNMRIKSFNYTVEPDTRGYRVYC